MDGIPHEFLHYLGVTNPSGDWYLWWSGIGSLLLTASIFGMVWKFLNCHESNCKRLGIHHVEGTPFRVCAEHHPRIDHTRPITADHIRKAHSHANPRIHL